MPLARLVDNWNAVRCLDEHSRLMIPQSQWRRVASAARHRARVRTGDREVAGGPVMEYGRRIEPMKTVATTPARRPTAYGNHLPAGLGGVRNAAGSSMSAERQ